MVIQSHSSSQSEQGSRYLTIGALAKLCGVTVRTLRYYEEMDLIGPVKRSDGKYRLYNQHSLKRVNAILALQSLNFSLDEILKIVGPYSESRQFTKEQQIEQTRASLEQQKTYIHQKMDQLTRFNEEVEQRLALLQQVCTPCLGTTPDHACSENCSFLEVHH